MEIAGGRLHQTKDEDRCTHSRQEHSNKDWNGRRQRRMETAAQGLTYDELQAVDILSVQQYRLKIFGLQCIPSL